MKTVVELGALLVSLAPCRAEAAPLPASCHAIRALDESPSQRPSSRVSRSTVLSTDGRSIFYFGVKQDFDAASFSYGRRLGGPLKDGLFARDAHDVYVQSPQSCGGSSCGEEYTGSYWKPLGVKNPAAFRWLEGGYALDDRFVYNVWHDGPVTGATPGELEVFLCGDEKSGFFLASDGTRFYRDGKVVEGDLP